MFESQPKDPDKVAGQQASPPNQNQPSQASPEEEFISVMPTKFKTGKKIVSEKTQAVAKEEGPIVKPAPRPKKNLVLIIIVAVLVVAIAVGGLFFYRWAKNYLQKSSQPVVEQPEPTPSQPEESAELKLTAEIVDSENQKTLSTGEIFFPAGALEPDKVVEFNGLIPAEMSTSTYTYISGIYKIGPETPALKKPAEIKITYLEELIQPEWEKDLKLGYFKSDLWTVLPAEFDFENNTVSYTFTLELIPADTFGIIVTTEKITAAEKEIIVAPKIESTADSDSDGLTDSEEIIYKTNANSPDSDFDGQADGLEIINLTDPTHSEGSLILSGLVKVYVNPTWNYSLYYPTDWVVKSLPETQNEQIMIITNTGEFFEISIQNNESGLAIKEWYLQQAPQISASQLKETTLADQSAIWGPDRLHLYVDKDNKVYILTYNIGTEEEANFKTTFQMIVKSFQFIEIEEPPEGKYRGSRSDNTLIKYPDATAVYLLENGKKRPIKSEAVYQRLGYTMWDIIEIASEEWYPTGEMIE